MSDPFGKRFPSGYVLPPGVNFQPIIHTNFFFISQLWPVQLHPHLNPLSSAIKESLPKEEVFWIFSAVSKRVKSVMVVSFDINMVFKGSKAKMWKQWLSIPLFCYFFFFFFLEKKNRPETPYLQPLFMAIDTSIVLSGRPIWVEINETPAVLLWLFPCRSSGLLSWSLKVFICCDNFILHIRFVFVVFRAHLLYFIPDDSMPAILQIGKKVQLEFNVSQSIFKGICYGSDPVVISLQLTNFQSLIEHRIEMSWYMFTMFMWHHYHNIST